MNRKALLLFFAALLCVALFVSCNQTIHAVVYYPNGGEGSMEVQKTSKDRVSLSPNKYYRTGHSFSGWAKSATDPVLYKDGETINIDSDVFLYAKWTPNTYTVRFDPNGGSGMMEDQEFQYQSSQALSENKFKAPHEYQVFINWKVKGSDKYYMDEEKVWNLTDKDKEVITLEAQWGEGIHYRKKIVVWEQGIMTYEYQECAIANYKVKILDKDNIITKLDEGWYAVIEDITVNDRMKVNGDVHLIIFDGATLTAPKGINVDSEDKLTIYDQGITNDDLGKIVITGPDNGCAGIGGGSDGHPAGRITIHGGKLEIQGGPEAAAIGGNDCAFHEKIIIYGGSIVARGGSLAAGIGSGSSPNGTPGVVEILGGSVDATGILGAGIGGGIDGGHNGTIIISGDSVVNAVGGEPSDGGTAGEPSAGIGGGGFSNGGKIYILGGTVTAKGGLRPEFDYGPKVVGSGIGGGNVDDKNTYGTLECLSDIKIMVSSDGKKWENYNGTDRKRYMRSEVVR